MEFFLEAKGFVIIPFTILGIILFKLSNYFGWDLEFNNFVDKYKILTDNYYIKFFDNDTYKEFLVFKSFALKSESKKLVHRYIPKCGTIIYHIYFCWFFGKQPFILLTRTNYDNNISYIYENMEMLRRKSYGLDEDDLGELVKKNVFNKSSNESLKIISEKIKEEKNKIINYYKS